MVFQRLIYDKMLKWKNEQNGKTALLIEGARRIGKSTIARSFAEKEYKSYILINFADTRESFTKDIKNLFEETTSCNEFFQALQLATHTTLYERESVIIFDEIQKYIPAREMIKQLVEDGRYDYIETGSLITLKKNSRKIVIPSEEYKIEMHPMSFAEFLLALNQKQMLDYIFECYNAKKPLLESLHKQSLKLFRTYMAVGGMPQAVNEYIETANFEKVDFVKKNIISLYREDLGKISRKSSSITPLLIYDKIQSLLSNHSFELEAKSFSKNTKLYTCLNNVDELESTKIVNVAYEIRNIDPSLTLGFDLSNVKVYSADTGLLISKMFYDKPYLDNTLYKSIILDKLSIDDGFLFENVVGQELKANGHALKYNSFYKERSNKKYSIDFLIQDGKKIIPIEVKSSNYSTHESLDCFYTKYHQYINKKIIIYGKNYKEEDGYTYLPVYMSMCL